MGGNEEDHLLSYGRQTIDDEDVAAVEDALRSDYLTTGPRVEEFEGRLAETVGARYGVAVSSGTSALHLACLALGIESGHEVVTSPLTFAASANCVRYCGGTVVFADVCPGTGLIDPAEVERAVTPRTRAIIPVDYAGFPCDVEAISSIARRHDLWVVEDAAHALGATYGGGTVGDCRHVDMATFSFHPVKHITTGEGGAITTNTLALYERLKRLRNHGLSRPPEKVAAEGSWYQEIDELGYNYRLTDFQCALGTSQLRKLSRFVAKRRQLAERYDQSLPGAHVELPDPSEHSSYHLYVIKVADAETRRALFDHLWGLGVRCQVHYVPVHWHAAYERLGHERGSYPNAEDYYARILSLPLYPSLDAEQQDRVVEGVRSFFGVK